MRGSELLAARLFDELVEKQIESYAETLTLGEAAGKIALFREAGRAFATLDTQQRAAIVRFFKVVAIDSVSTVLGTLDGVTGLLDADIKVICDGEPVSGELQDAFLALVESSGLLSAS